MRKFLQSTLGKICVIGLSAVLLAALGLSGYTLWHYQLPKFQDMTIELGQQLPPVSAFLTEYAREEKARLTTAPEQIDLSVAGQQSLQFVHNGKEETVTLHIVDTTPPTATFQNVIMDIHSPLNPQDFVTDIQDLSETTVSFVSTPAIPKSWGDTTVEVAVTDASGNTVKGSCTVHFLLIVDSFTLELGQTLTKADLLLNPDKDGQYIDQAVLDTINASPVGEYTVTANESQCIVTVQDTVAPTLELQPVCIDRYGRVKKENFIVKAEDVSGEVTTTLLTQISNKEVGTFTVEIQAEDINGNVTVGKTTLKVSTDSTPPVFSGLSELSVPKGSKPNYTKGVVAKDAKDGVVSFTYDDSKVDLTKAGTYYMTYSATDTSGNTVTKRRKVTVTHNAADTKELVSSVAAGVKDDVISLRNYVRSSIRYSSSWGGDDPVWYGFKNRTGNCYVHAMCLQALLREKGYETMLIWVTDKSHYWNLVKIDGVWRHVDATPGSRHSVYYNPMTDEQRYSCLQGRDWDRTQWPECN